MKTGKTLTQLAMELERQKKAKRDYIADTRSLAMLPDGNTVQFAGEAGGGLITARANENGHNQIGGFCGIPAKYYDRMRAEAPELLASNVNQWFAKTPARRMVRTLDNNLRAFLSDRYQRIDHDTVAEAILPVFAETPGLEVVSCEVTDRRLYIKAVTPRVRREVKKGDVVEAGVLITNSEIGSGAASISPLVHRLACLNGMVIQDSRFRSYHVGRKADEREEIYALLSDDTRRTDDLAFLKKARDVVRAALSEAFFAKQVEKMQVAAGTRVESDPVKTVELLSTKLGLHEEESGSVLRHLVQGGDLTRWGYANAVTRAAQDVESYDRSVAMELMGGRVLDLTAQEWKVAA